MARTWLGELGGFLSLTFVVGLAVVGLWSLMFPPETILPQPLHQFVPEVMRGTTILMLLAENLQFVYMLFLIAGLVFLVLRFR